MNNFHGSLIQQKGGTGITIMYTAVPSKRKSTLLWIFIPKDHWRTTILHHHFILVYYYTYLVGILMEAHHHASFTFCP